jgi:hypothetical protein
MERYTKEYAKGYADAMLKVERAIDEIGLANTNHDAYCELMAVCEYGPMHVAELAED